MPFEKGHAKAGGRQKGSRNKKTIEHEVEQDGSGLTPLAYMLVVLRDEDAEAEDRKWAAQAAAPYVHPRMAAIAHINMDDTDADEKSDKPVLTALQRKVERFTAINAGKGNGSGGKKPH